MDNNKLMLGIYNNPDTTYDATEYLVENGYDVKDVYSPFAIHGIERVLKIKRTRLSVAAFVFAMLGIASAISLIMYTGYFDWQINIGGKPFMHLPTYVPITFELGVLFTAFGLVGTFFIVNRMFWGRNTDVIDIRVTDDHFVIAINIHSNTDVKALERSLIDNGAIEVRERIIEL